MIGRRLTRRDRSLGRVSATDFVVHPVLTACWAEARIKIARMTLTIELDGNWNSFQLANSAPPLSVTDSAIAPSARIRTNFVRGPQFLLCRKADGEHMARGRPQ